MTRIITDNSKVNETLIKQNEILEAKMIRLISENRELKEQLRLHSVSKSAVVKSSGDFRDDDNRESQSEYFGKG